uniref:Uncharacterized protein n=1 Tax=Caenorhabditis japonica TaxID=281687 RepID=A0A8R1IRG3_CAEJA
MLWSPLTSCRTSPTRETHYHQKSSKEPQPSHASQATSLPHSTNPDAAKLDAPRRKSLFTNAVRRWSVHATRAKTTTFSRTSQAVRMRSASHHPAGTLSKKVLVVIMSHTTAVQPPRKGNLGQIKKFLETSTSTRPSHQQVDLSPAQLPPIAPSATPMRKSSNIIASPSQNGPNSRAVPSSSSRQPPPSPLVTGTSVNHEGIPYVLRKTRRKPTSPINCTRQQKQQASRQQTIHPKPPGTETTIQPDHSETRETATPSQKDHTLGLGRPAL